MSLHNAIYGVNPNADEILNIVGIKGKDWVGRFRDVYANEDGSKVILLTRNGGGNRMSYQKVNEELVKNPNYIVDYDDNFDCTYAYFEFKVPENMKDAIKPFVTGIKRKSLKEQTDDTIKEMESMTPEQLKNDPRFSGMMKMMEEIGKDMEKVEKGKVVKNKVKIYKI